LLTLVALYLTGHIDLRFGDETNFSMTPNVPYGWLKEGKQCGIPSDPHRVLNVFGLMSLGNQMCSYPTKGTIDANYIIRCLDDFAATIKRPTVVVLDNAAWHTAQAVQEKWQQWQDRGLFIWYLPTYSPHLNPIEILWRKMKYRWLRPEDYLSKEKLEAAITNILYRFGSEFVINFSMNYKLSK
jgi:transposase